MKDLYLADIYAELDCLYEFFELPNDLKDYDLLYDLVDKLKNDMLFYEELEKKEREDQENGTKNQNYDNN